MKPDINVKYKRLYLFYHKCTYLLSSITKIKIWFLRWMYKYEGDGWILSFYIYYVYIIDGKIIFNKEICIHINNVTSAKVEDVVNRKYIFCRVWEYIVINLCQTRKIKISNNILLLIKIIDFIKNHLTANKNLFNIY